MAIHLLPTYTHPLTYVPIIGSVVHLHEVFERHVAPLHFIRSTLLLIPIAGTITVLPYDIITKKRALQRVQNDGLTLQHMSPLLQNDEDIVRMAIANNIDALQYATPRVRELLEHEISESIRRVQANPSLFPFEPNWLRSIKSVAFAAIQTNTHYLQYADTKIICAFNQESLQSLDRIEQNGLLLEFEPEWLKCNENLVHCAIEQNPLALIFAHPKFRDDYDTVLKAVKKDGALLAYASPRLQNNEDIVQAAIQQEPEALQFASPFVQALIRSRTFIYSNTNT